MKKSKKHLPVASARSAGIEGVFHTERLTVFDGLAPRSREATRQAVENAHSFGDGLVERTPDLKPVACAKGCAYCCHLPVTASAPEIFVIVDRLRETWSAEALEALSREMETYVESAQGKSNDDAFRERLRCPLLDEQGACSVYDIRPLACRGWNAFDARECERAYAERDPDAGIRIDGTRRGIMTRVLAGLRIGALDQGLDGRPIRLVAGLLATLRDPTLLDGWLDGGIFPESCVDDEALADETKLRESAGSIEDSRAWYQAHFPRAREGQR